MIKTKKATHSAFGFNISSEIPLPELKQINLAKIEAIEPDIIIKHEDLATLWSKYVETDSYYYVKEELFMLRVPGVAIYKVENGKTISVSPMEGSNEDHMRLFLLGTCLGVVLMQRRILPIHGSCIAIEGKAYAFVGDSGVGKSTLASAFINRGYKILTDDVIALTLSNENNPMVIPSYPQQKLWQESLDQFGIESSQYKPVYDRETKFSVPVKDEFLNKPMPLAGIFELNKSDENNIEIIPIQNLERLPTLFYHTYRNFLISRSGLINWHFDFSANIVKKINFHRITRPNTRFTANELVDQILQVIKDNEQRTNNNSYQEGVKIL